ncbi:MAG: SBBP repeat-containing protein [candidate division WOR-3 bacterium]
MKSTIAALVVFGVMSAIHADPLWVRSYNGPNSTYDEIHAIGVDDSGNVVVSGFSSLSEYDEEFVTIKYRPDGDTAWLRHFDPGSGLDGATALAVDRSGNVIVTGFLGSSSSEYGDWVTIEYSPSGESLWASVYDQGDEDRPSSIVVDSAGNSYVTGRAGSLNYFDFTVVKYGPAGDQVWVFSYDGSENDGGNAVAVDNRGNTYATGYTNRGGDGPDLMTWKLGVGGESLWANVYDGPAGRADYGSVIAVDPAGNVVVAGSSADTSGLGNYITIKYGPTGETLWTRRYTGPTSMQDNVKGLALDPGGNVYVTGTTSLDGAHFNYATVKYAPDGTERWAVRYTGPRNQDASCGIALDSAGNVYVSGSSVNAEARWDFATVKYDPDGNQRWLERYDRPSTWDEAYVLAVSRQGHVYVAGRTGIENNGIDYQTLCYGAAGAVAEGRSAPCGVCSTTGRTIVRGVLFLPKSTRASSSWLLDASGRKVLELAPGANDVRHLSPGVYLVRTEYSRAQGVRGAKVGRVVIAR